MDAKTFYEQIAPELDPGGFKLYFTAQRLTGFELYKQFPYEDSRGMFEMMNGHQLMRYLLADQFHAIRWEIVPGTCYERAVLLPIDRTTPAYWAFEQTQPDQIDWERFERTVSHIIIGTDNAITVQF